MKIAFILPDLRGGGAEKVCINLATDWITKGHKITFVLMNKRGEYLKNISKKIKIVSLKKKKLKQIFFPLVSFFYKDKPDIILAQMWPLTSITVLAWLASFKIGKLVLVDHVHLSSSIEKEIKAKKVKKMEKSTLIGEVLAKRAKEKKIDKVYFDRGENKYHGRIKSFADSLRKNGLKF